MTKTYYPYLCAVTMWRFTLLLCNLITNQLIITNVMCVLEQKVQNLVWLLNYARLARQQCSCVKCCYTLKCKICVHWNIHFNCDAKSQRHFLDIVDALCVRFYNSQAALLPPKCKRYLNLVDYSKKCLDDFNSRVELLSPSSDEKEAQIFTIVKTWLEQAWSFRVFKQR